MHPEGECIRQLPIGEKRRCVDSGGYCGVSWDGLVAAPGCGPGRAIRSRSLRGRGVRRSLTYPADSCVHRFRRRQSRPRLWNRASPLILTLLEIVIQGNVGGAEGVSMG